MKQIEFTKDQYESLVKLAFIGEWILNAQSIFPDFKEEEKLVNYIFSKGKKFGIGNWFNEIENQYELKEEHVYSILPVIEDFSHKEFWQTLIEILTKRDIQEKLKDREDVEEEEYEYLEKLFFEKYKTEFSDNYLDNLRLK